MRKLIKPLVFAAALVPLGLVVSRVVLNDLGPDPAEELAKMTGIWAIRFLVLALAMTPLRRVFNQVEFVRNRRMIGLFALFYATCHFMVWLVFLLGLEWVRIAEELVKRPYITVGFSAYLILLALGITSPKFMVRKLGRNWKRLHRFVYVAGILAVIHLLWILRSDVGEAVLYGGLVALLLGYRLLYRIRLQKTA